MERVEEPRCKEVVLKFTKDITIGLLIMTIVMMRMVIVWQTVAKVAQL